MQSYTSLYPSRDRAFNVQLIKQMLYARTQEEFEEANTEFGLNLHPSFFAELDWMEMNMPDDQKDAGARLAEDLFFHHLPAIIDQRQVEFDLEEDDLRWEILENLDFYKFLVRDERQPLDVLGKELSLRIQRNVQSLEPDIESVISRLIKNEQSKIGEIFSGIKDPFWFPFLIDVEIQNAIANSLDHVTSRSQTKSFIRHIGGQFPHLNIDSIESVEELQSTMDWLKNLEDLASSFYIHRLIAVCRLLREGLRGIDVTKLNAFSGQLAAGYGHCGSCSMMYASSAIASYDPTCSWLFEGEDHTIILPYDFNVSVCPFCGTVTREDIPCMFYSPNRNQVIYNFPLLGQYTQEEARGVQRQNIIFLRDMFKSRVSQDEAQKFELANEEFTYDILDFLYAVQMGTTVNEEHVSVLVRFQPSGSGVIVDPTKGALIALTPTEMESHLLSGGKINENSIGYDDVMMKEALEAFSSGEFEIARDILERLYHEDPENKFVRRNLATAYVSLGDISAAKRVVEER